MTFGNTSGPNRRRAERIPVGFYVDQFIADDAHRCFTTDLSAHGLYVERVAQPLERKSTVVQLEIPLPEVGETLWAKGEIVYDRIDSLFHGTAIRFAGMARAHQRMLNEYLWHVRFGAQAVVMPPYRDGSPVRVQRPVRSGRPAPSC